MAMSHEDRIRSLERELRLANARIGKLAGVVRELQDPRRRERDRGHTPSLVPKHTGEHAEEHTEEHTGVHAEEHVEECAERRSPAVERARSRSPARGAASLPSYAKIFFDGGSRGNPGPCGAGYVIYPCEGDWQIATGRSPFEGSLLVSSRETNNYAEYAALIHALGHAYELGFSDVKIFGDSRLVVSQVRGEWRCGDKLTAFCAEARRLCALFSSCELEHIPRSKNTVADSLANRAMDRAESTA